MNGWVGQRAAPVLGVGSALGRALGFGRHEGALILGYHDVSEPDTAASGLTVGADDLDRHLRLLQRSGLEVVDLEVIIDRLEAGSAVDGLCAVTFDDALVGVHRWALPVLEARQVPATVFVVTDHLGVVPPWWTEMPRTMTATELADLTTAGHRLGSHTRTHRSLVEAGPQRLVEELAGSRDRITDLTGTAPTALAYPSGHHDGEVRRAARDCGYRAGLTFLNGRAEVGVDRFRLPRLTMGDHHSSLRLAYHVNRSAASWPDHQLDRVGP